MLTTAFCLISIVLPDRVYFATTTKLIGFGKIRAGPDASGAQICTKAHAEAGSKANSETQTGQRQVQGYCR